MSATPQFTKVKYDPKKGRFTAEYSVGNGNDEPDRYAVEVSHPPHPDLVEAIASLAHHVLALCELEGGVEIDQVEVRGVSFSYKGEVMGATITALRRLARSASPLVLNTPFKFAEPIGEDTPADQLLGDETVIALERVTEEALAFIDGSKRGEPEQAEMDLQDDEERDNEVTMTLTAGGRSATISAGALARAARSGRLAPFRRGRR